MKLLFLFVDNNGKRWAVESTTVWQHLTVIFFPAFLLSSLAPLENVAASEEK